MAGTTHDIGAIKDALVVLGAASIIVPLGRKLRVNPVIAFLAAGITLGPNGLGALTAHLPFLDKVTISADERIQPIAELGVVFLLFVIGLELSFARLMTMRRLVFGLGMSQVIACTLLIGTAASFILPFGAAMVVGAGLALSSTAIVIEVLSGQKRVASGTGRTSFAVLIFQDLAVVPILFLVGALSQPAESSMAAGLALAFVQAIATIALIVVAGKFLLRPLFRLVAGPDKPELFIAATLFVAVGTGAAAAVAGLSMALGAFIAGLLLAETEYRRAIETTIEPFKSLLLGVFFFAVGMTLDLSVVVANPLTVIAGLTVLFLAKAVTIYLLCRIFHLSVAVSIETGLLLAPAGEFAFVVFAMAAGTPILAPDQSALIIAIASVSMALIPLVAVAARRISRRFEAPVLIDPAAMAAPPEDKARRVIVVGHGRVGRLVAEMLAIHKISYLAVDADARTVSHWRQQGAPVYWGDASNAAFLESCGLEDASALIITIDAGKQTEHIVETARQMRPDLVIVARSRDADQASRLYALGVTDAVPETIEASLQLSEAALAGLGVPAGPVIASIHERRDGFRRELQEAAGRPTRAVKARRKGVQA